MSGKEQMVQDIFHRFDWNKDGTIGRSELGLLMMSLDAHFWTQERVDAMFKAADIDENKAIDYKEFCEWAFNSAGGKAATSHVHGWHQGGGIHESRLGHICSEAGNSVEVQADSPIDAVMKAFVGYDLIGVKQYTSIHWKEEKGVISTRFVEGHRYVENEFTLDPASGDTYKVTMTKKGPDEHHDPPRCEAPWQVYK